MAKLIIWVTGRPTLDGYAKREFKWSELHRKFIYEGKEYSPAEFNAKWDKAFSNNQDLFPQAMVVDVGAVAPVAPPPVKVQPVPPPAPLKVTAAMVSVDLAEEVMMKLAPERLKAKPGPKPKRVPELIVS